MTRQLPIDRTLKVLEIIADSKGLKLEDVEGYTTLCQFLTDLDLDGCSKLNFTKADTLRVLKRLIAYVTPSWAEMPMEFHQMCQPVSDITDRS